MDVPTLPGLHDFVGRPGLSSAAFRRVDADASGADDTIATFGTTADYWRAVVCPCSRTDTGRSRRSCPLCLGATYVYPPDMRCFGIKILFGAQQQDRKNDPAGGRDVGSVSATFPAEVAPQRGDLVLPRGQTHFVDEVLVRGKNPLADAVAARRRSDLVDAGGGDAPDDSLRYPTVQSVAGVWGWNPEAVVELLASWGRTSLAGLMPGQLERVYGVGMPRLLGWEVVDGNLIRWQRGQGPELGDTYTVKYEAQAVYCIVEDPGYRADGDKRLQRKPAKLIRYDAVGHDERLRGIG